MLAVFEGETKREGPYSVDMSVLCQTSEELTKGEGTD
jgi:hypothetical protein